MDTFTGERVKGILSKVVKNNNLATYISQGNINSSGKDLMPSIPLQSSWSQESFEKRVDFVENTLKKDIPFLCGKNSLPNPELLRGNIENYIGMTQIPTGIIGPLRITGSEANGDFYIPMATTEGALVSSYNRGVNVVSLSGGAISICLSEAVQRTPSFVFESLADVSIFVVWALENIKKFKQIVKEHTKYGSLEDIKTNINGNQVTLIFDYHTGDASGQSLVTVCTYAVCKYIQDNSPVKPKKCYIEGNLSGDKKASSISFTSVRGKKVVAEAIVKKELVKALLNTTPEEMFDYWKVAIVNGIQSGSIGVNGHFANGLTGIFMACGQDVASIAEASVGITRCDITENGDLYTSVTLPNLIVGTVGGGTWLPTQNDCLEILECSGGSYSKKFAEICAAGVLCGEISIIAAVTTGDFARVHKILGKRKALS